MIKNNRLFFTAILMLFTILISCKDNSTNNNRPYIEITNSSVSLFALNDDRCNFASNEIGSAFLFEIGFDSSSDIEIDGIEFDVMFVEGAEFPNTFTDDFDLTNDGLEFIRCFRFEETERVEIDLKILANDESIESNEVSITIDRPEAANKI